LAPWQQLGSVKVKVAMFNVVVVGGGIRRMHFCCLCVQLYGLIVRINLICKAPPPHRQMPVEENARGRSRAEQHNSTTTMPPTMVKKRPTLLAATVHSRLQNRIEEEEEI